MAEPTATPTGPLLDALSPKIDAFAARLEPVYALLKWHWHCTGCSPHIPTSSEIAENIRRLVKLSRQIETGNVSTSSGGITVWIKDGDAGITFEDSVCSFEGERITR